MSDKEHSWSPPEGLPSHSGDPLPADGEFFVPPPEAVGNVVSAYTTLTRHKQPTPLGARLLVTLILVAACAGLGLFLTHAARVDNPFLTLVLPAGLGLLAVGIYWAVTRFKHTCTYVGETGVAKFVCTGSRDNVGAKVFAFRDAAELRTSQTRRYVNGVYSGTDYTFTWTDIGGRPRHVLKGTYHSEAGTPSKGDLFYYATAAEVAWSTYLLAEASRQIRTLGEVRFSLGSSGWVKVGPDRLSMSLGGAVTECETRDIASVSVQNGVFIVKRTDAREGWFSSSGVFKFDYGKLANAQLFLFVLDKIAGIRIG